MSEQNVPGTMLQSVVAAIGQAAGLSSVDLWSLPSDTDTLSCRAAWRQDDGDGVDAVAVGAELSLEKRPDLRHLVQARETVEVHTDGGSDSTETLALERLGLKTRIDLPLLAEDDVVGVLSLAATREVRRFDGADRQTLETFGQLAAQALHCCDLQTGERRRHQGLWALVEAGRLVSADSQAGAVAAAAEAAVGRLLEGVSCTTAVVEKQGDHGYARIVPDPLDPTGGPGALEARQPDAIVRQAMELSRAEQTHPGGGTMRLIVPLVVREKTTGYLDISASRDRRFLDEEVELLLLLADQTAAELGDVRAVNALKNRAATDPLTGLYARWYYYERLVAETARAHRYKQPLSLVMAELDQFASIQAERGAAVVDSVMLGTARLMRSCLRGNGMIDVACNLGGGRFAVLMPNTRARSASAGLVADRVRKMVQDTGLHDDDHGSLGRLTMSMGIAGFPVNAEDADELADAAEAALNQAISEGRNRIKFSQIMG